MSGDPMYTMLLLGMGLRQLSVTPHNIPEIKKIIRSVTIEEADAVAQEAHAAGNGARREQLLAGTNPPNPPRGGELRSGTAAERMPA